MKATAVVDTSALVSSMIGEEDSEWFVDAIRSHRPAVVSAGSVQELVQVMTTRMLRAGDRAEAIHRLPADVLQVLDALETEVSPVTPDLAILGGASSALLRRTPARLDFGDGFSYALARHHDCPIVCKGNDFPATGIDVLMPPHSQQCSQVTRHHGTGDRRG